MKEYNVTLTENEIACLRTLLVVEAMNNPAPADWENLERKLAETIKRS